LEGTFKGRLVPPPCNEQGHLQLHRHPSITTTLPVNGSCEPLLSIEIPDKEIKCVTMSFVLSFAIMRAQEQMCSVLLLLAQLLALLMSYGNDLTYM